MKNIIGIDPSLISTGMCVNESYLFNYTTEKNAFTKNGLSKWYNMCEELVTYRFNKYTPDTDFTDSEISKINSYNEIVDNIINDIKCSIKIEDDIYIGIENYSYSSEAGPLIDLVTYGTILRTRLMTEFPNAYIKIYPPSTLKLLSAKLTYPTIIEKKKEMCRNYLGTAGGKFTKHDMYLSIVENETINSVWKLFLQEIKDDVFESKTIKKPIEDVNDAYLIYEVLKREMEL